jgi:hypothetical protein
MRNSRVNAEITTVDNITVENDGFIIGVFKSITALDKPTPEDEDEYYRTNEVVFEVPAERGTVKELKLDVGMALNAQKSGSKRVGSKNIPVYNKFTTFALKMELITLEKLQSLSHTEATKVVMNALGEALDKSFKFKLVEPVKAKSRVKNKGNYKVIDVESITPVSES